MFKIVLRPEEQTVLHLIKQALYQCIGADPVVSGLMALGMLECDVQGQPRLTQLGEAALARMAGSIH